MATPNKVHRIGGASVENLRLKPREATLPTPGISVISAATPFDAAEEMRTGLPWAKQLHRLCETVASADLEAIRSAGFDLMPTPSDALPNHFRIIHPEGAAGFTDENLLRLSGKFTTTEGC